MKRGFSMFELLLVVGIAAVIFSIVAPVGISLYRTQLVEEVRSNIIDALQKARHNALLQKGDTAYGVHVVAGSYTIFQGATYATRNESLDESFPVVDSVVFSGQADIIFAKLTGVPTATGTIAINYNSLNRGIAVDQSGGISKVDIVNGVVVITPVAAVFFDANGGTGSMSAQSINVYSSANLNSNTFTRTNYVFTGWALTAGGEVAYANNVSYTISANDVTLYAHWITVPGAPTMGTAATSTGGQATITFTGPASDGGSPITTYTAVSSPGGFTGMNTASPIIVTGLTNGTAYTFTVSATNVAGTGPASSASNSVTPSPIPSGGLVSYWALDGNATDLVGSNNGTITGAVATTGVRGLSNTAYGFDGVDDRISFPLIHPDDLTYAAWIKTTLAGPGTIYCTNYGNAGTCWHGGLVVNTGKIKMDIGYPLSNYRSVTGSVTVNDGKWHYVVMTSSSAGSFLYVDGALDVSSSYYVGQVPGTSETNTNIGTRQYFNASSTWDYLSNYTGSVDQARVYSRALSASEISDIYNAEKPVVPSAPTSVTAATSTGGQATVTYTAPANGGEPITSYTVTSSPGGISTTTASTTAIVTGLTNGTAYTFTVTATNSVGTGPASSASNSVIPLPTNVYWVGGTGNWSDAANHWAATSGGVAGANNLPGTITTNVVFDANSGAGIVTVDSNVAVAAFTHSKAGLTVAIGTYNLAVTGASNLTNGIITIGISASTGWTTGNLTVGASGTVTATGASKITLSGNFDQSSITSRFNSSTATITINGNGTFTADGTVDSTQYNSASLVLNGTNTLMYANLASYGSNGFNNLTVGQSGNTTTLASHIAVSSVLTVGSGTLSGGYWLYLRGLNTNPLVVDTANSVISLSEISFNGNTNVTIPALTKGYDCIIGMEGGTQTITQTGNIILNSNKSLIIASGPSSVKTWFTDGYNLTIGGTIQIGSGADTGLKKLDATRNGARTSTIIVGGNWLNYGTGTASSTFVADNSTVILNGSSASGTLTSGAANSPFYNLTINQTGTTTLQDALVVSGNLTLTVGTLDTKNAVNNPVTLAGSFSQAITAKFLARSSTITMNGNGTFTADGTLDPTQFNSASLVLNGTNTLTYTNRSYSEGFKNLTVGQNGNTTTLSSIIPVMTLLTVGSGTLTGSSYMINLLGPNPLSFNSSSTISVGTIYFYSGPATIPALTNGYDCNILVTATVTQTGDIVINSGHTLSVGSYAGGVPIWKTDGYNLTVGSNLTVGNGTDTGLKKLDATRNVGAGRTSIITVGGNWKNFGNGTASSTFIADNSTVILTSTSASAALTSGAANSPFYNLTLNQTGTTTLQDALVVSGNLTLTAGTLDTKNAVNNSVTLAGSFSQATTAKFLARSSTITVNGNGTFAADGTLDSTQYNSASLVLNGTNTLTYGNLTASYQNGFNNLTTGQSGNTTTANSTMIIKNVLTIGPGTLTGSAEIYVAGVNPLVFDANSHLTINYLSLHRANQNIPTLINGYDCNIRSYDSVTQVGDITITAGHNLFIIGINGPLNISAWNTDGYNLTLGGNIQIGSGADTGLKKLDATRNGARTSTITVGGNWLNYGNGTAPSQFIADNSTVILNATATGKTVTAGGSSFNNLTFNGSGGGWTLQDSPVVSNFTMTLGTLAGNSKTITVGTGGFQYTAGTVTGVLNITVNATTTTGSWASEGSRLANLTINNGVTLTPSGGIYANTFTITGNIGLSSNSLIWFVNSNNGFVQTGTVDSPISIYFGYATVTDFSNGAIAIGSNKNVVIYGSNAHTLTLPSWSNGTGTLQMNTNTDNSWQGLTVSGAFTTGNLTLGSSGGTNRSAHLMLGTSTSISSIVRAGSTTGNQLSLGSGNVTVSGNIDFTGISVTPGSSTLIMSATATGKTITSAGQSFNNLTFNGVGGGWTLQDALSVSGNLLVSAGTLAIGTYNLAVTGNSTVTGGTATIGISGGTGWTTANFTIGTGGVVTSSGASIITASGNWNSSAGTFNYGASTVNMTGTGSVTTLGWSYITFYKLSAAYTGYTTTLSTSNMSVKQIIVNGGTLTSTQSIVLRLDPAVSTTGLVSNNSGSTVNLARLTYSAETANTTFYVGADAVMTGTSIALSIGNNNNVTLELNRNLSISSLFVENSGTGTIFSTGASNYSLTLSSNFTLWSYNYHANNKSFGVYFNNSVVTIGGSLYPGDTGYNTNVTDYFYFGGANITIVGNYSTYYTNGTYASSWIIDPGTSTVNFTKTSGTQTVTSFNGTSTQPFYNLTKSGAGTLTLADNLVANGAITHSAGTLNAGGKNINITGNLTISDGALVTAAGLAGSTLTVGGNFSASGHAGALLTLNPASLWYLNVAGTAVANYVNAAYSNAGGGTAISQTNSTNGGNNTNWSF